MVYTRARLVSFSVSDMQIMPSKIALIRRVCAVSPFKVVEDMHHRAYDLKTNKNPGIVLCLSKSTGSQHVICKVS